jgi:hypothetical protein
MPGIISAVGKRGRGWGGWLVGKQPTDLLQCGKTGKMWQYVTGNLRGLPWGSGIAIES